MSSLSFLPVNLCSALLVLTFLAGDAWSVTANLTVNGRVRFTPMQAEGNTLTVLPAGTPVHVLGQAQGDVNWFRIRFPNAGKVWVHGRNLVATDDQRILRVTSDGVRVRTDSRVQAPEVGLLHKGELVRWVGSDTEAGFQGRKVGDWFAVQVQCLPLYVHRSVLKGDLPTTVAEEEKTMGAVAKHDGNPGHRPVATRHGPVTSGQAASLPPASRPADSHVSSSFARLRADYEACRALFSEDPYTALQRDWTPLQTALQSARNSRTVSIRERLLADRMLKALAHILAKNNLLQRQGLIVPKRAAAEPAEPQQPRSALPGHQDIVFGKRYADAGQPSAEGVIEDTGPAPQEKVTRRKPEPAKQPEPVKQPEPAAVVEQPVKKDTVIRMATDGARVIDGWLFEEANEALKSFHVLKNRGGDVLVYLRLAPGVANIQLADFKWQRVVVTGTEIRVGDNDGRVLLVQSVKLP